MILVDTSVWVDHFRSSNARLVSLLGAASVLMHPFVLGELACGSLRDRALILGLLHGLPSAVLSEGTEVLSFIERHALHGKGIGYVDVHLLASAALSGSAKLWTHDKRLLAAAQALGCAHQSGSAHRPAGA